VKREKGEKGGSTLCYVGPGGGKKNARVEQPLQRRKKREGRMVVNSGIDCSERGRGGKKRDVNARNTGRIGWGASATSEDLHR